MTTGTSALPRRERPAPYRPRRSSRRRTRPSEWGRKSESRSRMRPADAENEREPAWARRKVRRDVEEEIRQNLQDAQDRAGVPLLLEHEAEEASIWHMEVRLLRIHRSGRRLLALPDVKQVAF